MKAAQTIAPALSPARRMLARHQRSVSDLRAEIDRLSAPDPRRESALRAEADAVARLADIDRAYDEAAARWLEVGGIQPPPLTADRIKAEAALKAATPLANAARLAANSVQAKVAAAHAQLGQLEANEPHLIAGVLWEAAEALGSTYIAEARAYLAAYFRLVSLHKTLSLLPAATGRPASIGLPLASYAPVPPVPTFDNLETVAKPSPPPAGMPQSIDDAATTWRAFAVALRADAAAPSPSMEF